MTWKPIETAPKDGTKVDLWVLNGFGGNDSRHCDCYFRDGKWWWLDGYPVECETIETRATHWMPPPSPPRPEKPTNPQSRLQEIRLARGLTGAELARAADMNAPTVYRIDTGLRGISANFRGRLAMALGVTPGALYEPIGAPIPGCWFDG